ncbi:hypothetical protein E4T39_06460 [Aureobasidium subglaciale]|nr:hypothetical protein E4T39_06460 [Aureobasidium subglaciale]
MKFIDTIALLATTSSTLAAPLQARHEPSNAFTLDISFSNSPLQGPIQASNGSFYIGKPPSTSCPSSIPSCPTGNTTSFTSSSGLLHLNTQVPGGQQVYISREGLLTYTIPHSAAIPPGSQVTGFDISPGNNQMGKFFDFWLCSVDAEYKVWRIWAEYRDEEGVTRQNGFTGSNACTMVSLLANDVEGDGYGAWQYD